MNILIRGIFRRNRNRKTPYYRCIMGIVINRIVTIPLSVAVWPQFKIAVEIVTNGAAENTGAENSARSKTQAISCHVFHSGVFSATQ